MHTGDLHALKDTVHHTPPFQEQQSIDLRMGVEGVVENRAAGRA
jgi:hypothetical protein